MPWFSASLDRDWRGEEVALSRRVEVDVRLDETSLHVHINAPYFGNAPPSHEPGSTPELWMHEVVELFILGEDARYLEAEFGPHGHYLLLTLHGERQLVEQGMRCTSYEAHVEGDTWRGHAILARDLLPPSPTHFNLYAIHATPPAHARRFLALSHEADAARPDFHRLDVFLPTSKWRQKRS